MDSQNHTTDAVVNADNTAENTGTSDPRSTRRQFLGKAAGAGAAVAALLYLPEDADADVPHAAGSNATPEAIAQALNNSPRTRLDEVGHLTGRIAAEEAADWKAALRRKNLPARHAALLHLWLGEYALTAQQQPEVALKHFQQAKQLTVITDRLHGWAAYNIGIARVYNSQWKDAIAAFRWTLYHDKPALKGFDRAHAALWLRHAGACSAYNEELRALGIPRPPKLDVLCVAGGFAAVLRSLKLPYDKKTVTSLVRVTGRGSNLQDALDACDKWNATHANGTTKPRLVGRALFTDEDGLKALPKPLIAFVEREHFVAVIDADADGVVYQCTDCGIWPGGRVSVTWEQWRAMKPGIVASIVVEGSKHDTLLGQVLTDAQRPRPHIPGVQVAMNPHRPGEPLLQFGQLTSDYARLAGHLTLATVAGFGAGSAIECGFNAPALHCLDCASCCPEHGVGPGGGFGSGGFSSFVGVGGSGMTLHGSSAGDPVNLATLEEEYAPPPDLTVYNPTGPAVVWQRMYSSRRGNDLAYQNGDFGQGWTHPFNYAIWDPSALRVAPTPPAGSVPRGSRGAITPTGATAPAGNVTWDIVSNGTVIATASSPSPSGLNGGRWFVTLTYAANNAVVLEVTAPAGATVASGYLVRYKQSGTTSYSGTFAVTAGGDLFRDEQSKVPKTGTTAPSGTLGFEILRNGSVVATSDNPNGWSAQINMYNSWDTAYDTFAGNDLNAIMVKPPLSAPLGSGYEVRLKTTYMFMGVLILSGTFTVNESLSKPTTGTKYLVFPNGARASFVNSTLPTAANPTVLCTTQAGVPLRVTLHHDPQDIAGRYTVLFADGTTLESTRVQHANRVPSSGNTSGSSGTTSGTRLYYGLDRLIDKVGNSIQMVYGQQRFTTIIGSGPVPLLSAINDSAGQPLLTFTRDTSDGFLTQVDDRYGRNVYYQKVLLPTNSYFSPTHRGIAQVSQIVATGATNRPMRHQYGYSYVYSGIGYEQTQLLTSMTVPSPTGTGTSTTTIEYAPYSCYVSKITDANGNTTEFTEVYPDGTPYDEEEGYYGIYSNHTRVTVKEVVQLLSVKVSNLVFFTRRNQAVSRPFLLLAIRHLSPSG